MEDGLFPKMCIRDRLGYDTNFTIYDTEDQKTVMKSVCQKLQLDSKLYKERMLLNAVSYTHLVLQRKP